jgi:hypothetical protein
MIVDLTTNESLAVADWGFAGDCSINNLRSPINNDSKIKDHESQIDRPS